MSPEFYKTSLNDLSGTQREHPRKIKGSNNRERTWKDVARVPRKRRKRCDKYNKGWNIHLRLSWYQTCDCDRPLQTSTDIGMPQSAPKSEYSLSKIPCALDSRVYQIIA